MEGQENSIQTPRPYTVHISFEKYKLNPGLKGRIIVCKISFQLTVDGGK